MRTRYGEPPIESVAGQALANSINVLSFIFARIYFPTYSNGLKEIARHLGFTWSEKDALGIKTIVWRNEWEKSREASLRQKLVTYNAEDCEAVACVARFITELSATKAREPERVVDVASLPLEGWLKFGKTHYLLPALEEITRATYWDYQREKIVLRSDKRLKEIARVSARKKKPSLKANSVIYWPRPHVCPACGGSKLYRRERSIKRVVDVRFHEFGIERWVTTYIFHRYQCPRCTTIFINPNHPWDQGKYGRNLLLLFAYLNIELHVPQRRIGRFLSEVLGFRFAINTAHLFKTKIVVLYKETYEKILRKIIGGGLIHADETKINLFHGGTGYIWAFTSMEDVAYLYSPSERANWSRRC